MTGSKIQLMNDYDALDKLNDINNINRVIERRAKYFKTHIIKYNYDPNDKDWDNNEIFPIILNIKTCGKMLTAKNPKNLYKAILKAFKDIKEI